MKLTTRDTTFFALLLSALIAGGYVLFIISRTIPVPGFKYVIMAPYFALVLMFLMAKVPRKGAILLFNAGFAGIMSFITPVMGFAILSTGAMTEGVFILLSKGIKKPTQHMITASSYSAFAVLTSILFTYWLTNIQVYEIIGPIGTAALTALAFILGAIGAYVGLVIRKRISQRNFNMD